MAEPVAILEVEWPAREIEVARLALADYGMPDELPLAMVPQRHHRRIARAALSHYIVSLLDACAPVVEMQARQIVPLLLRSRFQRFLKHVARSSSSLFGMLWQLVSARLGTPATPTFECPKDWTDIVAERPVALTPVADALTVRAETACAALAGLATTAALYVLFDAIEEEVRRDHGSDNVAAYLYSCFAKQ